jgi:RNA polymerase sigma-70 factor, ECF subfamily
MVDDREPQRDRDGEFSDLWSAHRTYLVDLAFRMLGNIQDAEDAVQEAFGRLLARDLATIDDARGWLIVVVSRICLDQLRSARNRRETRTPPNESDTTVATAPALPDPADRVTLDDSIRMALLVVLQQLTPAERAVFVLHDVFQFSFDAVGSIVERSPAACRQIASRARRRIESETGPARFEPDLAEQQRVAQRFIAACSGGDLDALMALLDPDVVGDVDLGTTMPARAPLRGRSVIAPGILVFYGPKSRVTLVSQSINGNPGVLAFRNNTLVGMLQIKTRDGLIHDLHAIADPEKLSFVNVQLTSSAGPAS